MGVTVHYQMNTSICGTTERPPDQPCQRMFEEAEKATHAVLAKSGISYRITHYDERDLDKSKAPFYGIIVEINAEIDAPDQLGQKGKYDLAYGWEWRYEGYDILLDPDGKPKTWRARPKVWHGGTWCKTAGADDWLLLHLSIVTILETWKEWELVSSIQDEGGWHPDHDITAFAEWRELNEQDVTDVLERLDLISAVPAR